MSFIAILSTQLLVKQFIDDFQPARSLPPEDFRVWQDESGHSPPSR
jgi:hypothetical protein